jgi:hypothetical protein
MNQPLNMRFVVPIVFICFRLATASAQPTSPVPSLPLPPVINDKLVRAELQFLSSEWFEGRMTGERGNEMAADYLGLYFREIGLEPFKRVKFPKADIGYREIEEESFFQEVPLFRFTVSTEDPLTVITHTPSGNQRTEFSNGNDFGFYYSPSARNVGISTPVVFAGYGISMPDRGYNDYEKIDVRGKITLISMGYPGYRDTTSAGFMKMKEMRIKNYSRWNKIAEARKRGAAAVLFLYTTQEWYSPTGSDRRNYTYGKDKTKIQEPGFEVAGDTLASEVPVLIISSRVGSELFKGTGLDLSAFDSKTASDCKPASALLKDKSVDLKISKNVDLIRSSNIIGCIPGENPDKFVVVGAHYDHIGKTKEDIYYGADDNASGSVAVMAIARACMEMKTRPKHTILFALWTGEEEGLLGSGYFLDKWNNGQINSYFNFDMISRYNPRDSTNFLDVCTPKKHSNLKETIVQLNKEDNLNLRIKYSHEDKDSFGGSDYAPFAIKGIPYCCFFTGFHPDYHEETDASYNANTEAMTKIINLGFNAVWHEANLP